MCGRYVSPDQAQIERFWHFVRQGVPNPFAANYNIAPSMEAPVIRQSPQGECVLHGLRWGLVPNWATDPAIGSRLNNARAESVGEKRSFQSAYRRRRCLIPALGFYEWQPMPGERKQPWYFRLKSGDPMAMGGLWESWTSSDGTILRSFCVITTTANELMAPVHDRMPVIIPPAAWAQWLDPRCEDRDLIAALLQPQPAAGMEAWPVAREVNNGRAEGVELIRPVTPSHNQQSDE